MSKPKITYWRGSTGQWTGRGWPILPCGCTACFECEETLGARRDWTEEGKSEDGKETLSLCFSFLCDDCWAAKKNTWLVAAPICSTCGYLPSVHVPAFQCGPCYEELEKVFGSHPDFIAARSARGAKAEHRCGRA